MVSLQHQPTRKIIDMRRHQDIRNLQLQDMKTVETAWLALVCAGLTNDELRLLDCGGSNARIESKTRTASKLFSMTLTWVTVNLCAPSMETDDPDKAQFLTYRRLLEIIEEHKALQNRLKASATH